MARGTLSGGHSTSVTAPLTTGAGRAYRLSVPERVS